MLLCKREKARIQFKVIDIVMSGISTPTSDLNHESTTVQEQKRVKYISIQLLIDFILE